MPRGQMTPWGLNGVARPEPVDSDAVDARCADDGRSVQLGELRRQLMEREAQLQQQYKTLAVLRSIKNEQDATIERLTAEINSYRETTTEFADARERDRELTLFKTHVGFLEDTVATRGALIEEQLRRMQALQSAREQLSEQLGVLQRICDERLSLIDRLSQQIQNERASNTQEKTAVQRLKAKVIERLPPAVRTVRNKLRGS